MTKSLNRMRLQDTAKCRLKKRQPLVGGNQSLSGWTYLLVGKLTGSTDQAIALSANMGFTEPQTIANNSESR